MTKEILAGVALALAPAPVNVETVSTETAVAADVNKVWAAIRDVYAVDKKLVPGMVTKVETDGDVRVVTFSNGFVVKERIIDIDDKVRRVIYTAIGSKATYHLATMEVLPDNAGGSRIIWRTHFLPAELRPLIANNMEQGSAIMKVHLERE